MTYGTDFWDTERTLGAAVEYYSGILSATVGLDESGEGTVKSVLAEISENGVVRDATDVTTVLIGWDAGDVA